MLRAAFLLGLLGAAGCSEPGSVTAGGAVRTSAAPLAWGGERKLVAPDGAPFDAFGVAVALSPDLAVVGIPFDDEGANADQGSVFVFERESNDWRFFQKLTASDGGAGDQFGRDVAISGDTLLLGANLDTLGPNDDQGSAYVFEREGGVFVERQKLIASDGGANDLFGSVVALEPDRALVAAPFANVRTTDSQGKFYVFERNGAAWEERQILTPEHGGDTDLSGASLALEGNVVVAGAPYGTVNAQSQQGYVTVYRYDGTEFVEAEMLAASDGSAGDHFGIEVALAGPLLLVGAPHDANESAGAVHVFTSDGATFSESQKLTGAGDSPAALFGSAVALAGDTAAVGAPYDNVGTNSRQGSLHLFERQGSTYTAGPKLSASDGGVSTWFGGAVAAAPNLILVGAPGGGSDEVGQQGAAYVLRLASAPGDPCELGAECVTDHCADGVCCDLACEGPCAACSVEAGADSDGTCKIFAAGSDGSPACAPLACDGEHLECAGCDGDAACPDERYCAASGRCELRSPLGSACDLAPGELCLHAACRACTSGHCVDGVCCESSCGGECEACSAELSGRSDGRCEAIPADTDPQGECEESDSPCQADGACSGQRTCRLFAKRGAACGETECLSSNAVSGELCDGMGECEQDSAPCEPYVCEGGACRTDCASDRDCTDSAYCFHDTCQRRKAHGDACTEAGECASGYCVDGVCCNGACLGQCEACAEPDTTGTCTPVVGEPRGARLACSSGDGENPCSAARCDGEDRSVCRGRAGSEVPCRAPSCADAVATLESGCDGKGNCPASRFQACSPYLCAGDECSASCETNGECGAEFRCTFTNGENGECVARDTSSCSGHSTLSNPDGTSIDCSPFACAGVACLTACQASSDCADGFLCNPSSSACEPFEESARRTDAGCACRGAPRGGSGSGDVWAALFAIVVLARARRPISARPKR